MSIEDDVVVDMEAILLCVDKTDDELNVVDKEEM
jgi:hypothetical protein